MPTGFILKASGSRRCLCLLLADVHEARIEPLKRIVAIHRNDEPGDIISREMGAPLAMARAEQAHWRCHFEQAIKAIENLCLRLPIAGLSKVVTEHRAFPDNG